MRALESWRRKNKKVVNWTQREDWLELLVYSIIDNAVFSKIPEIYSDSSFSKYIASEDYLEITFQGDNPKAQVSHFQDSYHILKIIGEIFLEKNMLKLVFPNFPQIVAKNS